MVEFINVTKMYRKFTALDNVSFDLKEDDITGIIGHNGAGKTTLFMIANGLCKLNSGEIIINGYKLSKDLQAIKGITGFSSDKMFLYNNLTVKECIRFFMGLNNVKSNTYEYWLRLFKIEEYKNKKISKLSTGMLKKVYLLISVVHSPKVLFLDEPFSGLDPNARGEFIDIIKHLNKKEKLKIIISSHDLHELQNIVQTVVVLKKGKVVEQGVISRLMYKYFPERDALIELLINNEGIFNNLNVNYIDHNVAQVSVPMKEIKGFIKTLPKDVKVLKISNNDQGLDKLYYEVNKKCN